MIYRWKSPFSRLPVQQVGEHLEQLRDQGGGRLTPAAIVEDARAEGSLLHTWFTWDDHEAAEAHRLEQARQLLRMIVVVREDHPAAPPVRAYVSLREAEDSGGYYHIDNVMSDASTRARLLRRALAELDQWKQRYADLVELADIYRALDAAGRDVASEGMSSHGGAGEVSP